MKKTNTFFIYLIFFIFIIVIGIYLGKKSNPAIPANTPSDSNKSTPATITNEGPLGSIIYLMSGTESDNIYKLNIADKSKKIIYTDKDEVLKMKQCQSMILDGSKILATMATITQEFGGSLWFISGNGNGDKTKLMDNFASTTAPAISIDGSKVAYVVFSNVEPNYGFSLIVSLPDGSNRQILASDTNNINNVVFSRDNTYVYYLKGTAGSSSGIYKIKIDGSGEKEIYHLADGETIYSLTESSKQRLAMAKGPLAKNELNKTEIYTLDTEGKDNKRITTNDTYEDHLVYSPDGAFLAYRSLETNAGASSVGEMKIVSQDGKDTQVLSEEVNGIIGWIN